MVNLTLTNKWDRLHNNTYSPTGFGYALALSECFERSCLIRCVGKYWLDKGRIEGFKIERTMDIHAAPACRGRDPWI